MEHSEIRYLASKKTVDDRALHHGVVERLRRELRAQAGGRLSIIEMGAGLGTMVARLCEWELITQAEYTLLDVDGASLREARNWLGAWGRQRGLEIMEADDRLTLRGAGLALDVRFIEAELVAFLRSRPELPRADLLVANAFLDLVDVPYILPFLFELVKPSGLYYFSINYDAETIFSPVHPDDDTLMAAYHRTMDQRIRYGRQAGEARCGRRLFEQLRAAQASILAAGSSDWVVMAEEDGGYVGDEAYFVEHILHTIELALENQPDVDGARLAEWLRVRRGQLAAADLVYIAHQLDFVGRRAP